MDLEGGGDVSTKFLLLEEESRYVSGYQDKSKWQKPNLEKNDIAPKNYTPRNI